MEVAGSRFLVTGGSRGIGRALASLLLDDGARVAISGRDGATLEATRRALAEGRSERLVAVEGDVAREEDARRMVEAAVGAFGGLDVVVNNAAILPPPAPVLEIDADTWRRVLDVNVVGTVNVIRAALGPLDAAGGGAIVNLSSTWGRTTDAGVAPYCASKFAVEALTQSLAQERRPGPVVVAVNPGIIATEMLAVAFEGDVSAYPPPQALAPAWRALFARLDASWHGRSVDLATLAP